MKYANTSRLVRWSGGTTVLSQGDSIDEDHPLYLERPAMFSDTPPPPKFPGPARRGVVAADPAPDPDPAPPDDPAPAPPVVERATRAPGERRITARKTKEG